MKKIITRIGMILFILGVVTADSPDLIWPLSLLFGGILLIKLVGGLESL